MSRVVLPQEAELHVLNLSDSQVQARISAAEFQRYCSEMKNCNLKPHWSSFLTEGFFDANVWGPMIDSLWLGEQDMILVRKEVDLLRKDEKRKSQQTGMSQIKPENGYRHRTPVERSSLQVIGLFALDGDVLFFASGVMGVLFLFRLNLLHLFLVVVYEPWYTTATWYILSRV